MAEILTLWLSNHAGYKSDFITYQLIYLELSDDFLTFAVISITVEDLECITEVTESIKLWYVF